MFLVSVNDITIHLVYFPPTTWIRLSSWNKELQNYSGSNKMENDLYHA